MEIAITEWNDIEDLEQKIRQEDHGTTSRTVYGPFNRLIMPEARKINYNFQKRGEETSEKVLSMPIYSRPNLPHAIADPRDGSQPDRRFVCAAV